MGTAKAPEPPCLALLDPAISATWRFEIQKPPSDGYEFTLPESVVSDPQSGPSPV